MDAPSAFAGRCRRRGRMKIVEQSPRYRDLVVYRVPRDVGLVEKAGEVDHAVLFRDQFRILEADHAAEVDAIRERLQRPIPRLCVGQRVPTAEGRSSRGRLRRHDRALHGWRSSALSTPELRGRATVPFEIRFAGEADLQIERQCREVFWRFGQAVEVGGYLLGTHRPRHNGAVVCRASDGGPDSKHWPGKVRLSDADEVEGELPAFLAHLVVCGDWHSHPSPEPIGKKSSKPTRSSSASSSRHRRVHDPPGDTATRRPSGGEGEPRLFRPRRGNQDGSHAARSARTAKSRARVLPARSAYSGR
jgi:hypothetical protein